MKINHFSIFRPLVLLALILATIYSMPNEMYAQKFGNNEYYSGAVAIDPVTQVPTSNNMEQWGWTGWLFTRGLAAGTLHRDIIAYPASELGPEVRLIHSFGFYVTMIFNDNHPSPYTGLKVMYRFTEENIYIPTWSVNYRSVDQTATYPYVPGNYQSGYPYPTPETGCEALATSGWYPSKREAGETGGIEEGNCNTNPGENTQEWFESQGYKMAFYGNIDFMPYAAGGWLDFNLPEPYLYDGKKNLHIVVLYEDPEYISGPLIPYLAYRKLEHVGLDHNDLQDHPNDGYAHMTAGANIYTNNFGKASKPILKLVATVPTLGIKEVQPLVINTPTSYRHNTILKADADYAPSTRPAFTLDLRNIIPDDASLTNYVRYMIVGPTPYTDTVYRLVNPSDPSINHITITKNEYEALGAGSIEVAQATGPMAWTTATDPEADNHSLDLRNVRVGEYRAIVDLYTEKDPPTLQFQDTVRSEPNNSRFYVRTNNDIEVFTPTQPGTYSVHPITDLNGMTMNVPIVNSGLSDINEFWAQAYLHKVSYNPETGSVVRLAGTDTLPRAGASATFYHFDATNYPTGVLKSGQTMLLTQTDFSGGFNDLEIGWYDLEIKLWLNNPNAITTPETTVEESAFTFNNVYPRGGGHHLIQAQALCNPYLTRHTNLNAPGSPSTQTSLGRTMSINVGLVNEGLLDLSNTSGVTLETTVYKLNPGNTRAYAVFSTTDIATRGGVGEGEVTIYCDEAWYVSETGSFEVNTVLIYPDAPAGWTSRRASVSSFVTVRPGLSGNYTIGVKNVASARNYTTINRALRDLYANGMTSNCVFELTDSVYNEEPYIPSQYNLPALDFRSKIAGASEIRRTASGRDSLYINTIRFVPSAERALETKPIKINLISRSGVGMWFGATDEFSMYPEAMVNIAAAGDKNIWHRNDGNITWDGGTKKSIEFVYNLPQGVTDRMPGERFRAPIYMTNAKNITITNCVITDGTSEVSGHYQLPGNTYIGPALYFANDYDFMTNDPSTQKTYSAGIIIHSNPLIQMTYGENRYNYETFPCNDIVITNNDISRFAYGIVDIGMNYQMTSDPFVIDVIDTLYGVTRANLDNDVNLSYLNTEQVTNPDGTVTEIAYYTHKTIASARSTRYYKLYNNNYVVVLDSAAGGVRRAFNYNNIFTNNVIHEVGRAGIFAGNSENLLIAGNRIHGISGQLTSETGTSVSADCAGIFLGGTPRISTDATRNYDAFIVLGAQVYNNEISNVTSGVSASGIKFEQNIIREAITADPTLFPDRPERIKIYSNIVWGVTVNQANANRYGISLSISKPTNASSLFATVNDGYYIDDILLANNTIILDEDNLTGSRGDYYGLYLQKVKNAIVQNNAIELLDSTLLYSPNQYDFAAAGVFYQGPSPVEANNKINYNIYAFKTTGNSDIAAYRYVSTDYTSGVVVDKGYSDEYKLLRNWQNWMKDDLYSNTQSFAGDLVKVRTTSDKFEKLRLRTNGTILNSPLDKRGIYIAEAITDIDGQNRLVVDQTFDIGAQIVDGVRNAIDVEVVNIVSPATYQSMRGPLMDAEYFMIEDKPITVRVLVRNNGSTTVQSKKITLSVLQESALTNNKNARIHTDNYTNVYYNDEAGHNMATLEFEPINPNAQITYARLYDTTKTVAIPNGEGVYVDFNLSKTFNTYITLPGYEVPIQFSRMTPNVTPRYLFTVTLDNENDMKQDNNVIEKYARFYVKKSKRDMLISASNTFNTISYNNQPLETVTNPDMVAGRLNLDSLISGFRKLNLHQSDAESREFDFDVIDRAAWDFRNVDYTLYKTIYFSDELKIDTARWFSNAANYDNTYRYFRDRWLMQNLNAFLNKATSSNKSNLIVGSEEHISDIHAAIRQHEFSFLQPNNTIKRSVVDAFYRTNAIFDSLWHDADTDPNAGTELAPTLYGYSPRVPLSIYRKEEVTYPYVHTVYEFTPQPYLLGGKDFATITGVGLFEGFQFEIKATPWANGTFADAPPFGTIIKPIESPVGFQRIGAVADTITERGQPITGNISDIPNNQRIVSLLQNTLNTNIVFLGFDWRHYGNLDMLLTAIDEHVRTNGGYEGGSSLPISFYGFDAQPLGNRVELAWNTASETIIDHFELERANASNNNVGKFELLKSIKGMPNTNDNHYNTTDDNLPYGSTLAYRLKLINADGSFTYSNNRIVKIEEALFSVSDITPNPVTSSATFSITSPADQSMRIAIYDLSGREVLVLNDGMLSGNANFDIQNTDLAVGTYTLSVRSGNQTITRSFTVVK